MKATGGSISDGEVCTHEEDDDGGDADGGDEDPLVVAAAALQLPVRRHPRPAAAAVDLPPARIRGRGNEGEQQQTETARVGGRLGRTENVRGAGTESGRRGGRVRGAYGPRENFDWPPQAASQRKPGRSELTLGGLWLATGRPGYCVAISGGGAAK